MKQDNSNGFKGLILSSNKALNELSRKQEQCILKLLEYRNKPFEDIWEYLEWHRQAVALELSQTQENYKLLDWKALWIQLTRTYRNINGKEISKEHPFTEAVLINPLKPPPALTYIEVPTGKKDKEGLPKTRKVMILNSFMDGRHMQEATDFISQYIASSEAGFVIHRLTKQNALLKAEMSQKGYNIRDEIYDDIWQGTKTSERKKQDPDNEPEKSGDDEK